MGTRYRFFDSVDEDRIYAADAWDQVLGSLIDGDGVRTGLRVEPRSPTQMGVQVTLGQAWVNGKFFEIHTAAGNVGIAAADGANDRIDRIVARVSYTARSIVLAALTGDPDPSPEPPDLTQDSSTYESSLAQVFVAAASSTVEDADLTSERYWVGSPKPGDILIRTQSPGSRWHELAGLSLVRSTWPDLFDVFGTAFGAADGSHFSTPDARGRGLVVADDLGGSSAGRVVGLDDIGDTAGAYSHQLGTANLPVRQFATKGAGSSQIGAFGLNGDWGITTGSGTSVPNLAPSLAVGAYVYGGVPR